MASVRLRKTQNDLTYDESIVMALQLTESAIGRIRYHECADRPFINRTGVRVPLEEFRGDKQFQHKSPSKIHAVVDGRRAETVPRKRERGRVRLIRGEVVLRGGVHEFC